MVPENKQNRRYKQINFTCLQNNRHPSQHTVGNVQSPIATHHVTRHNTPIHNILSTAPQLSISHKALGTLPEEDNVMPKHVGATIHN
jgi:hypothetical protein